MTPALWCLFIAGLFPYPFAAAAKWTGRYNNHQPRDFMQTATGWRKRAYGVHLNSFEAFPFFAAAVLVAHLARGPNHVVDLMAMGFIAARVVYAVLYLADLAALRSAIWTAGYAVAVAIFVVAGRG